MDPALECAGVPRDLGVAQGRAWDYAVRRRAGSRRLLEFLAGSDPELARLDRDLWRHHPQLAERLDGLALGAGASRRGLLEALRREGGAPGDGVALAVADPGGAPLLVRLFPPCLDVDAPLVRLDRAEAGIPALVAAPAWLPAAVCGVNEAGLAVAVSAPDAAPGAGDRCRAPALVLVGDCLQRFSSVEGALAWCARRPVGGEAAILAVDAQGTAAGLRVAPGGRVRLTPRDGVLVGSGPGPLCEALAKRARAGDWDGPSALAARLLEGAAPGARGVWLDPRARRLGLTVPAAPDLVFPL